MYIQIHKYTYVNACMLHIYYNKPYALTDNNACIINYILHILWDCVVKPQAKTLHLTQVAITTVRGVRPWVS